MKSKSRLVEYILLSILILVAGVLRFYEIGKHFPLSGEVGHNLLAIKNAFEGGYIPLVGPPTSHPWLSFAPLFYWIYGPILYLSSFNPLSYAYFGAFVSVLILIIHFVVSKKIFNVQIALISTGIMSVSPLFLYFSWGARFFSFVPAFSLILFYVVYRAVQVKRPYLFTVGLLFGCMFSFHYTPLMLVPFVVTAYLLNRVRVHITDVLRLFSGLFIAMFPLVIYDVSHGMSMMRNVILWIPYRVAGFLGIIPKNTISLDVARENVLSVFDFFTLSIVPTSYAWIAFFIYGTVVIVLFSRLKEVWITKKFHDPVFLLVLVLAWGYLALFIHGSPPLHYFVPILFIPILLVSLLIQRCNLRYGGGVLLLLIVGINLKYYFSDQWIYRSHSVNTVSYQTQQQVVQYIVQDANGRDFQLRRVGIDDQFEEDYAQNYQYLLWWYGNEPVQNSSLIYTIYEPPKTKEITEQMHTIQQIQIEKYEK